MLADLRFALRLFARNPLFSAAVMLVLGLGAAASTTVFTLVDAYLVKPIPFAEPDRLVSVWRSRGDSPQRRPFSEPDFLDLKQQASTFSHLTALTPVGFNLSGRLGAGGDAPPEQVSGSRVSADFFPMLGATPALGRTFAPDEDQPGRAQVVVLSDQLFRRRFGADPSAVGRTVTLDGRPYEVLGVMPPSFRVPLDLWRANPAEFWVPAALTSQSADDRRSHSWNLIGRLAPGASFESADAESRAIAKRLEEAFPESNARQSFFLVPLAELLTERIKPPLVLLFTATLLLLVIASANVALLLSARAAARGGEVAVRAALGASRGELLRQFLVENLLLALGGGLVGFALSFLGVDLVAPRYEGSALALRALHPDGRVLGFALLSAAIAGLGFGLLPALRASRAGLSGLLKEGAARSTAGGQRRRAQAALLVMEVALSAVLLVGSSAVARGFYEALNKPLGFSTESSLTFSLRLPRARYADAASARALYDDALARLRALPAVETVGVANFIPFGKYSADGFFEIEGRPPAPPDSGFTTMFQRADGDYFRAMGIPLRRGRPFTDADREGSARVVLVSESLVKRFFAGEDPLGKRIRYNVDEPWLEVVGVIGDVGYSAGANSQQPPASYVPFRQADSADELTTAYFVMRTRGDPHALANAAREALRGADADLPLADLKTYQERTNEAFSERRFTLVLVTSFAASALVLTALGLFGLVSYQTRRRSRELAIRMALGAAARDVERLVVRDTSRLLAAGLLLGLPAAVVSGRLLASKLEGVPPADPLSLIGTALVLGFVGLAAVAAPARRAARTPPALVLRDE
jgi:putative ABC transport system permease protein